MSEFEFEANEVFYTSDTHFGHEKIINLCNRPFDSAEHMTEELIKNWNEVVSENGTVFHLGDFALGGSQLWNSVLDRLNGRIYLIIGNHDRKNLRARYMERFELVTPQMQIKIDKRSIYLNHYPFLCYGGSYRRAEDAVWQLFGHVHSGPGCSGADCARLPELFPFQYDVGVDNNNYRPVSHVDIVKIINKQVDAYEESLKQ